MNARQKKLLLKRIISQGVRLGASLHPGAVRIALIDILENADRFLEAVGKQPEKLLPMDARQRAHIPKTIRTVCASLKGYAPSITVVNRIRLIRSLADEYLQS